MDLSKNISCCSLNCRATGWRQEEHPGDPLYLTSQNLPSVSLADHYPSLGLAASLFWARRSVLGIKCEKVGLHCVGYFFPFLPVKMVGYVQRQRNRWLLTWIFFLNDLMRWMCQAHTEWWAWHSIAGNMLEPSFRNFFKTVFCITANSSGPSHEAVKGQTVFQRCREKVVFSTAPI